LIQKDKPFQWLPKHTEALQYLQRELLSGRTLAYPDMNKSFILYVDSSKLSIGYALAQEGDDKIVQFILFGGQAVKKSEQHLSSTFLELNGLLIALEQCSGFVNNGRKIIVRSDHLALNFIQNLKKGNSKLMRYSLLLQPYD